MSSVYTLKDSRYSSHMRLLELLTPRRWGKRLLDIGCGNGHVSSLLAAQGFEVTGVEHPAGFDANFPKEVRLIPHNLEQSLPDLGEPYNVIVIADVLEHLPRPHELLGALRPNLAPGGIVVCSLPNSGNFYFRLNVLAGRFPEDDKGLFDRTHLHFWMLDNWRGLFERSGYLIDIEEVTPIPFTLIRPGLGWLEAVCYHLARVWKTLFAYQFLVVARPKS